MSDNAPARPQCPTRLTSWLLWASFALFVVYPLSVGPVCWLYYEALEPIDTNHALERGLDSFYMPLALLADSFDPVQRFFFWYICDVWGIVIEVPNY